MQGKVRTVDKDTLLLRMLMQVEKSQNLIFIFFLQLLDQFLYSYGDRVKPRVHVLTLIVLSVHISAKERSPRVTYDNTVWIEHGDNLEDQLLSEHVSYS